MDIIVPRTCSKIATDNEDRSCEESRRPLESFRAAPAYVLLGDPGLGKSTAFEVEREAIGEEALLIPARDFLTLDINSHPEWRDKTLFIDGLDEIRAGSSDPRWPLDGIRQRLETLGHPPFRISCREAEWLGDNDRDKLAMVSPDDRVITLRLNPLTDADIVQILDSHPDVGDTRRFMAKAREQGVDGLLTNPLTLNMLATAVGGDNGWPESRLDTFEMACRQMATEYNREHIHGERPPTAQQLLDAAGSICAHQLLSGADGCSLEYHEGEASQMNPDSLNQISPEIARFALATKLFTSVGDGRFTPVHRYIAEFIGARHLAKLIDDGLPATRVLALITGDDGMVVTAFRGLSAWLATHCPPTRNHLIESDPVGVGLYGDLSKFHTEEKRKLLESLNLEVAVQGNVSAFGPLAAPDMECAIKVVLTDQSRDIHHQTVTGFLLRVLQQGAPLTNLSKILLDVVYDDSRLPWVAKSALDAFIHASAESPDGTGKLRQLLIDIGDGRVSDPGNEMLGALLTTLYPQEIPPSEVWSYVIIVGDTYLHGAYHLFWRYRILERSSDADVVDLLDSIHERPPALRRTFGMNDIDALPVRLLARALQTRGDQQNQARLLHWLRAATYPVWRAPAFDGQSTREIESWLEQRPDVQKAIFLEGILRYRDPHTVLEILHNSKLPADFRLWCMDNALALADTNPVVSKCLLSCTDLREWQFRDLGVSWITFGERTSMDDTIEQQLAELFESPDHTATVEQPLAIEHRQEENERRLERWVGTVRSNADALRERRASSTLLFQLAIAYFYGHRFTKATIKQERGLAGILGDEDLAEAATAGLQGAVWRSDVPDVAEYLVLNDKPQTHHLALPFLAGVYEIARSDPGQLDQMSQRQIQQALAYYYCTLANHHSKPQWYMNWVNALPDLVTDVLVQCAASAILDGRDFHPQLYNLAYDKDHHRVAEHASLHLLKAIPLDCNSQQLKKLDYIMWAALQHADRASLQALIEVKLSQGNMNVAQRIHWLVAGIIAVPETYRQPLTAFVGGRDDRIREIAAFFCPHVTLPFLVNNLDVLALHTLINLLGHIFEPLRVEGTYTNEMYASEQIHRLINRLSSLADDEAAQALEDLANDDGLSYWHAPLEQARNRQRVVYRDATYQGLTIEQVCQTLNNAGPANASDLAAIVVDRLDGLAQEIRTGNTDDWRQYWNEDPQGRPTAPKHEDHCRDAFLSDLRAMLPSGVDAQPEGQYAHDKRADVRFSCGDELNVPMEIKRDRHRDLWTALRAQLMAQYTSDPATGGYGIYLVFWFGAGKIPRPPQGNPPTSPQELREQLEEDLTEAERRKISVYVVDVSQGGQ